MMVLRWNTLALHLLKTTHAGPPQASRTMAMVHAAIYDAINAIDRTHRIYKIRLAAAPYASIEAACATAAHTVLVWLYSEHAEMLDGTLKDSLAVLPDDQTRADGITIGVHAGKAIIQWRKDDHADDVVSYQPRNRRGAWRPTPPDYAPAQAPQWARVRPFALHNSAQFRSAGPPLLGDPEYGVAFYKTKHLGAKQSPMRTEEQTDIAHCWADGAGTVILWNMIAQQVVTSRQVSLVDSARILALLNITLADAVISAWDDKYHFNLWRPITAIREAESNGNALTETDPAWEPLRVTTPEPEHTSAHSTVSGAAARILALFFDDDHIPFTVTSVKPPDIHRAFGSFSVAAREASDSRIYAGLHFAFSTNTGLEKGRRIAEYIWQREMR